MAKALVLGSTGHIGSHIVRALLADGHRVRAAYRNPKYLFVLDSLDIERVPLDLNEPGALSKALDGCEWVFNAAGFYPSFTAKRAISLETAIRQTNYVFSEIKKANPARVVFTSSAATIKRIPGRVANEDDFENWPLDAWRNLYSSAKIAMEHEALKFLKDGLPLVVVNPSVCIGGYDAHCFSGSAVLAFAKYKMPIYMESSFNAIYTGDVGVGHVRAASLGRVGERYILANENFHLKDFANLVAKLARVRPPFIKIPYHVAMLSAYATEAFAWITRSEPLLPHQAIQASRDRQVLDPEKARRELKLPTTSIEEAIQRAIDWFSKNGYIKTN
jgi:dihydroflavonol-4-reductase